MFTAFCRVVVGKDVCREVANLKPSARGEVVIGLLKQRIKVFDGFFNASNVDIVEWMRKVPRKLKVVNRKFTVRRYPGLSASFLSKMTELTTAAESGSGQFLL